MNRSPQTDHPPAGLSARASGGGKRKKIGLGILLVVGLIIVCLFVWGPLFPWNPVKIGYDRVETRYADIFVRDRARLGEFYADLDPFLAHTEELFGLDYRKKMTIIVSFDAAELTRFMPWIDWRAVGGVALHTGNVVYVNQGRANSNSFDPAAFVQHEATHILLYQHTTFAKAWEMKQQQWLMEGTAVYNAGPRYLWGDEFARKFASQSLVYDGTSQQLYANLDPREGKFNYTLYGRFVEYLIDRYGQATLQRFVRDYLDDPAGYRHLFRQVYGVDLAQVLEEFERQYEGVGANLGG